MSAAGGRPARKVDAGTGATNPATGEQIHVPGQSVLPLTTAFGIMLMVIGLTIWYGWSIIGFAIFAVSVILWIRDAHREFDALPDDEPEPGRR